MRTKKSKNKLLFVALIALVSTVLPTETFADSMSSANYTVKADVMSVGGGYSDSSNYQVNDTVGELGTGENLASANYRVCSGFQCQDSIPYLSFTLGAGITAPGTSGAGVDLGNLDPEAVTTSNGSTVNSLFFTVDSNGLGGTVITIQDANTGLKRLSAVDTIPSASATLTAGNEGYGVCVFSLTQEGASPGTLTSAAPFNGTCTKTTGHAVGGLTTSPQTIVTADDGVFGGVGEILVKASISGINVSGDDYNDIVTVIATSTY